MRVITMTQDQRKVFDEGVQFSFELIKTYIEKNWNKECKTENERRDFIFDIWSFIEGFNGNITLYQLVDNAMKAKNISEECEGFFYEGINEHSRYVLFCLKQDERTAFVEHCKDYFAGKTDTLPNKTYHTFNDWLNA